MLLCPNCKKSHTFTTPLVAIGTVDFTKDQYDLVNQGELGYQDPNNLTCTECNTVTASDKLIPSALCNTCGNYHAMDNVYQLDENTIICKPCYEAQQAAQAQQAQQAQAQVQTQAPVQQAPANTAPNAGNIQEQVQNLMNMINSGLIPAEQAQGILAALGQQAPAVQGTAPAQQVAPVQQAPVEQVGTNIPPAEQVATNIPPVNTAPVQTQAPAQPVGQAQGTTPIANVAPQNTTAPATNMYGSATPF